MVKKAPKQGIDRRSLLATTAAFGATAGVMASNAGMTNASFIASASAETAEAPASSAVALKAVEQHREAILRISREVWELAETSLAEVKSSAVHIRELEAAGFKITSTGSAGVPTAFVAEWKQGTGGPVIAYLPEYDALPGLGNATEPRQTPSASGITSGHGCGHNMLGAGCTGAAFALKSMMEEAKTPGTIRVYGCAAEETEGAKVYMVREGMFNDVDVALAWHPAPIAATGLVKMNATNNAKIMFHGRTAHAGNAPWEGRSALKAAALFDHGIQMMREHIMPTARLHFIYEQAGVAPNVIPDFAQIWITIRDTSRDSVNAMTEWARQIADGVAMATQTRAEFDLFFGMYDLLPNDALAKLLHEHMNATPLEWTEDEQVFARMCQKEMGAPEEGLAKAVLPPFGELSAGGSTDIGDISYTVPAGVFLWPTMPLGIGLHTWPLTACAGMSIGDKASLSTARILAGAGFDLMSDPALLAAAKESFKKRRGDKPFVSPLPPTRKQPLALPAFLVKTGQDDAVSAFDGVTKG